MTIKLKSEKDMLEYVAQDPSMSKITKQVLFIYPELWNEGASCKTKEELEAFKQKFCKLYIEIAKKQEL